jgi:hypothetical protein
MKRAYKAAIAAVVVLIALAAAGCEASAKSGRQPAGQPTPPATTQASVVGSKWLVTSITSHGKQTPIPSRGQVNQVYVLFTTNGHFGGDEPVNFHWGTYRLVGDGFSTSRLVVSAASYTGGNPVTVLAIDAISAFDNGVHAKATVTGNRLVISVGGFLLNCQRDGIPPASLS